MTYILGLSAYYHDSAAVLLLDGEIIAAAQEERFSRIRHDESFPEQAIQFCLKYADITLSDIEHVVFYDKPFLKFERLLETHLATAPMGLPAFIKAMPVWLKEKLYLKKLLRDSLCEIGNCDKKDLPDLLFTAHHQSHAASAYYASPFNDSAVLCLDGVGEWATTSAWLGKGNRLDALWQINFPHSIGLLYSAFTYYTGFRVNSGEYKLMGLAPYGEARYVDLILNNLLDLKDDGSFRLNMTYFNFASGLTMTSKKFHLLFGAEPRLPESDISQRDMDIARSIQVVTEEIVLRLAKTLRKETGCKNLCLAGGVALNCVANGRLLEEHIFDEIWVQPAAGDAGGALGAAYLVLYQYLNRERSSFSAAKQFDVASSDRMHGALLGPEYNDDEIEAMLLAAGADFVKYESDVFLELVTKHLDNNQVVGWFQGRMEFGPRALGSRSILADARSDKMQSIINLKIKNRESFRPFAPAILLERLSDWFEMKTASPYMLFVTCLNKEKCLYETSKDNLLSGIAKLKIKRSLVPAVTHVDYSARVQTVSESSNSYFYKLLKEFENRTKCPILINTSFNVRGEPIVESPFDALRCFMKTDMDVLAIGSYVLLKDNQSHDKIKEHIRNKKRLNEEADVAETTVAELRKFAVNMGVIVSLIFGFFIPWLYDNEANKWVFIISAVWAVWGVLLPNTILWFYKAWMKFGVYMSKITTPLILSAIYFGLITPLGFTMRIFGSDPLNRKLQGSIESYRVKSQNSDSDIQRREELEKPF